MLARFYAALLSGVVLLTIAKRQHIRAATLRLTEIWIQISENPFDIYVFLPVMIIVQSGACQRSAQPHPFPHLFGSQPVANPKPGLPPAAHISSGPKPDPLLNANLRFAQCHLCTCPVCDLYNVLVVFLPVMLIL